jgi:hypothetical protein
MAVKQSAKAQVGGGLFVAGIVLALPGVAQIAQGAVGAGLAFELIPAALIVGGLRLKKSGRREAA